MELPVQLTIYIVIFFNIVCRDTSALKSDAYDLKLSLEEKNSLEIVRQNQFIYMYTHTDLF